MNEKGLEWMNHMLEKMKLNHEEYDNCSFYNLYLQHLVINFKTNAFWI